MIDPKARAKERKDKGYSDDGPSTSFLRATGKFTMAAVGIERFNSSAKGTPGLMIRLVVVEGDHAGDVLDRDFWLTQNALFQLADFALAFGFEEPFDEKSDDDIEKIITSGLGVVTVKVQAEGYTKSDGSAGTKYNADFFSRYAGEAKDSWKEYLDSGEKSFNGYLRWRANTPRATPGQARQQPRQRQQQPAENGDTGEYDDGNGIPF